MKALALVTALCVASVAVAQDQEVTDAPFATKVITGKIIAPDVGELLVGPGLYLNSQAAIELGGDIKALQVENEFLKKSLEDEAAKATPFALPPWALILSGAVLVGVGIGVGTLISK